MSSSISEICPRSILRYRPIDTDIVSDVSTWTYPTKRHHCTATSSPSPISTPAASSSLALAVVVGLGMCFTLVLILVGQSFIVWAHMTLDDWQYGRPRTFQTDLYVGQESSDQPSHFLAINNHGQVEIIEFPGGDPTHARLFLGPHLTGINADLTPVTLRFLDPHHTHHPDMLVLCGNISALFLNRQGTFQADTLAP